MVRFLTDGIPTLIRGMEKTQQRSDLAAKASVANDEEQREPQSRVFLEFFSIPRIISAAGTPLGPKTGTESTGTVTE